MKEYVGILAPFAIILIVYLSVQNWRTSIKTVLVLVILEGVLRKWVIPQASQFIYFLKDIVIIGAYLRYYFFSSTEKTFRIKGNSAAEAIAAMMLLLTGWCIWQCFNPNLGSPIIGIFGIRGYLLYIPLVWMLPKLFRSEEELYRFLRSYLLLVIPVGLLAVAQFFSPPSSPLNVYAQDLKLDVATFGDGNSTNARVTGTFSYIVGYSVYAIISFGFLVPLLAVQQSRWWRWATIVELMLIIVTSFMNGSRTLFFGEILFLIGYFGAQLITNLKTGVALIKKFTVPFMITAIAVVTWFQSALNSILFRINANNDISARTSGGFIEPFEFMKLKGLDSYGVGATHQATSALRSILNLPPTETIPVYYESEMGRIVLEIGPTGFFLWYLLRLILIYLLWHTFLKLKRPLLRQLALSAFLIHTLQFNAQLVFNHTLLVYYWFLAGFIFLLPRLEQIENWKQQELLE
ncbi:hypothetical protein H6G41_28130 [Tolypothrix sp. FACHB-123]|uniref:hypothetical protein n=1 Tax=Tolypothrix sp. FACHB-123 TaxID=2692868 RepID=UPI0016889946|nr:hypothetical protein [Tolypothrix sp. FACHB-123]MBD2358433.1 hypothetical protein [Tolypothrix sp. FACHB-123]